MASKYELITELADVTAKLIASDREEWTKYLKTAARLYRYPFREQMLIYAQRPDATAVASMEIWNNRMNCWVNRGAKGIALIDETRPRKLKYVFDVSNVHKSRNIGRYPHLWKLRDEHKEAVMRRLEFVYGKTNETQTFEGRLIELADRIAGDYTKDILPDLKNAQEDGFLEGLDDLNLEIRLRETLSSSIAYTLLSRCGLDADDYVDELNFEFISDFSTLEALNVLGDATTSMCEPVLMDICRVVDSIDLKRAREAQMQRSGTVYQMPENKPEKGLANAPEPDYNALKRESGRGVDELSADTQSAENKADMKPQQEAVGQTAETENAEHNAAGMENAEQNIAENGGNEHGDHLQTGRGLSDTQSGDAGRTGGDADEIRNAPEDIPEGTPFGDLLRQAPVGQADRALPDDTEAGRGTGGQNDRPDDEVRGSDRGTERPRPDGMGMQDELDPQQGGRGSVKRDRLQPVVEVKYEQMTLFPSMAEQIGSIEAAEAGRKIPAPAAFSLSEEQIGEILRTGSGRENSRMRIYEKYCEGHDSGYMADFLKHEYGTCGKGFVFDGHEISVWFGEDGMKLGYGRQAQDNYFMEMSWSEIEAGIERLVNDGEYLNSNEAFLSDSVMRDEMAENVYFFFRDTMDEMPESIGLSRREDEQGNTYSILYAEGKENLKELLATPEGVAKIRTEVDAAVEALRTGEKSMRFRLRPTPEQLQEKLSGYARPKIELPQKDDVSVKIEEFITQDEIDYVLGRGSGVAGGKFRIYEYAKEGHDRKDFVDFLKREYGIGGHSAALPNDFFSNEEHSAKGINIKKGGIMEPLAEVTLSWNVVAKRITELVFEDKYLTKEQLAQYEQKQLEAAQAELSDSEDVLLKNAKNIINDFCLEEYEHEADFSDLSNVEVAYTDWLDEETGIEYAVQVTVDLQEYSILTSVDGDVVDEQKYDSLEALTKNEFDFLDFDSLVSLSDEVIENLREKEIDKQAERAIDVHEAELGADGSRAFPHLNDEPEQENPELEVAYTVAEDSELLTGRYYEDIATAKEAVNLYDSIKDNARGLPSIGIKIHEKGTEDYTSSHGDFYINGDTDSLLLDDSQFFNNPVVMRMIDEALDLIKAQEKQAEKNPLLDIKEGDTLVDKEGVLWQVEQAGWSLNLKVDEANVTETQGVSARSFWNWRQRVEVDGTFDETDNFRPMKRGDYLKEFGSPEKETEQDKHSEWSVTANPVGGEMLYSVYRQIDTSKVDYSGNRENPCGYVTDRKAMEELAEKLNANYITDLDEAKAYADKFLADREKAASQETDIFKNGTSKQAFTEAVAEHRTIFLEEATKEDGSFIVDDARANHFTDLSLSYDDDRKQYILYGVSLNNMEAGELFLQSFAPDDVDGMLQYAENGNLVVESILEDIPEKKISKEKAETVDNVEPVRTADTAQEQPEPSQDITDRFVVKEITDGDDPDVLYAVWDRESGDYYMEPDETIPTFDNLAVAMNAAGRLNEMGEDVELELQQAYTSEDISDREGHLRNAIDSYNDGRGTSRSFDYDGNIENNAATQEESSDRESTGGQAERNDDNVTVVHTDDGDIRLKSVVLELGGGRDREREEQARQSSKAKNFHITDHNLGVGTPKEKFQRNIEAIKTLQTVEAEGRAATPEEQETLSKYVGWGGLADAFDESKSNWAGEYAELKSLLTPEEYASARESTLNAHYTSPAIIEGIYETLGRFGFEKGNILEPSMGVGNFFGMLPEEMQKSKLYGVELDSLTGRLAKQLYPEANIQNKGFEETNFPNDFFDVAVGNVPFGQYKVADKEYDKQNLLIHDYFFAKTLDKVRPGGIVAFVTSKGTMDKQNESVRKYLAERAEFLGGVRLPNTAFKANAGTEVTSDILIFKKRDRLVKEEPEWVHTAKDSKGIEMNAYFANNPEQIVGHMEMVSGPFGQESACLPDTDRPFEEQLKEALGNIEGSIDTIELAVDELGAEAEERVLPADPSVRNFSYTVVDNEVYYRENSVMNPVDVPEAKAERIKGMVAIRDCTRELIDMQMDEVSPQEIAAQQKKLNDLYDAFEKKHGRINSRTNKSAFDQDSSYSLLCSLEKFDSEGNFKEKADMFTKRTIKRAEVVTSVDTASEALAVSLSEKARVDLPYMAELAGKSEQEITDDLAGVIFKEPVSEKWQTADEYLSGNVREKLAVAEKIAESDTSYAINVEALKRVMPPDLDASEIEVRIGATWIEPKYIDQFMKETLQTPDYLTRAGYNSQPTVCVQYSDVTGVWNVKGKNADYNNPLANSTYGTQRVNAYKILEESLNLKDCRVFDTILEDGKEKRVLNKTETTLAAQKQEALREAFKDWVFRDPERRAELVKTYNELFNSVRPREYDGEHLKFPGMSPEITLRPHQKNAVAHQLYGNNTLLAHCVGAGKTFEMTAAAMESKRLGLCRKSLFVVPNHLTEQWGSDFLQLYPGANILVATKKDFEPANRKKFCSRIATGDYDAVIIGHSQFEKIPLSAERQAATIEEQIEEIENAIAEAKAEKGERYTIKEMEKSKKALKVRLEKLNDRSRKDDVVTFEQLGVDRLFVDESHSYKNLFLYTKMRNVAGIAQTDAQKSSDMFAKCQYMDELTGGKGVVFATGTPVSNSMTELYTMQRYLQYDTLKGMGLQNFDAWASTFGETVTALELAPEGTGFRAKTRFSKFFNLPELMKTFKDVADIKTADMLNLPRPKANYHTISVKPTEAQKELVQGLSERATMIHNKQVRPEEDNMLKITSDGRKIGLDQRLINPLLPDEPGSKVNTCVDNVYKIWNDTEVSQEGFEI